MAWAAQATVKRTSLSLTRTERKKVKTKERMRQGRRTLSLPKMRQGKEEKTSMETEYVERKDVKEGGGKDAGEQAIDCLVT